MQVKLVSLVPDTEEVGGDVTSHCQNHQPQSGRTGVAHPPLYTLTPSTELAHKRALSSLC